MKRNIFLSIVLLILVSALLLQNRLSATHPKDIIFTPSKKSYWMLLYRKSNQEFLYFGESGNKNNSTLIKTFKVKAGIPNERPTPLPKLLEKEYWVIINKFETPRNLETGPFFLTLNIPVTDMEPYGPTPYFECRGQCNWVIPGEFGLHGSGGDRENLSDKNSGSSGCIRHFDEDITYLYNLLDPKNEEIRYYIEDI